MNLEKLIEQIIELYIEARKTYFPHERISRGESHVIASKTEDLFASYLIKELPGDTKIFINQIITSGSKETRISIKPDLVIVRNNEIRAILDLKMDLGRMRPTFPLLWDKGDALIPQIRNKEFRLQEKKGETKKPLELKFSKQAKLYFLVISKENNTKEYLAEVLKRIGKKKYSETYFLTEHIHPNNSRLSKLDLLKKIILNNSELDKLLAELKLIV